LSRAPFAAVVTVFFFATAEVVRVAALTVGLVIFVAFAATDERVLLVERTG